MSRSIVLSIPVICDAATKELALLSSDTSGIGVTETNPLLLYGLHGGSKAKADVLSAFIRSPTPPGQQRCTVDLVIDSPADVAPRLLTGRLHTADAHSSPFLNNKLIGRGLVVEIGTMWKEWAIAHYGAEPVRDADVDWRNELSYIPAFPYVADRLFAHFPNLRCAILPVKMTYENLGTPLSWVGVMLRTHAKSWVSSAEVRSGPSMQVHLAH